MVLSPDQEYHMSVEAAGFVTQESTVVARTTDDSREMALDVIMRPVHAQEGLTRNEK